jgi:hypothetical protein
MLLQGIQEKVGHSLIRKKQKLDRFSILLYFNLFYRCFCNIVTVFSSFVLEIAVPVNKVITVNLPGFVLYV